MFASFQASINILMTVTAIRSKQSPCGNSLDLDPNKTSSENYRRYRFLMQLFEDKQPMPDPPHQNDYPSWENAFPCEWNMETNIVRLREQWDSILISFAEKALPFFFRLYTIPLFITSTVNTHFFFSHMQHNTVRAHAMAAKVTQHDIAPITAAATIAIMIILLLPWVAEVIFQTRFAEIHVLQFGVVHKVLPITTMRTETSRIGHHSVIICLGIECLLREYLLQMGQMEMLRQSCEELHILWLTSTYMSPLQIRIRSLPHRKTPCAFHSVQSCQQRFAALPPFAKWTMCDTVYLPVP